VSALADDGTRANRVRRDGAERDRGASQTHGAGDPSGVDAEPEAVTADDVPVEPPSAATR
jgi:hypothetical protein